MHTISVESTSHSMLPLLKMFRGVQCSEVPLLDSETSMTSPFPNDQPDLTLPGTRSVAPVGRMSLNTTLETQMKGSERATDPATKPTAPFSAQLPSPSVPAM